MANNNSPTRVQSKHFNGTLFALLAAALVAAPVLAAANLFHSYLPYFFLRLWVLGFCWYSVTLARRAGGIRRSWQAVYVLIALPFILFWGLSVSTWAVIDLTSAAMIGTSAIFLRSEPAAKGAA